MISASTPILDSVVTLDDVSWKTYVSLRDNEKNRNVRMTYDRGTLWLMSPSRLHERIAELIAQMVIAWTDQHSIPRLSGGSTTMKNEMKERGAEPDKCFYIANEATVRNRDEYDPEIDPPPDIVIEVDLKSMSRARMPIYADFGVPEIWRWVNDEIEIYHLRHGEYVRSNVSAQLVDFPFAIVTSVLNERHEFDETSLIKTFRLQISNH